MLQDALDRWDDSFPGLISRTAVEDCITMNHFETSGKRDSQARIDCRQPK
jgi:hypothetical protein